MSSIRYCRKKLAFGLARRPEGLVKKTRPLPSYRGEGRWVRLRVMVIEGPLATNAGT